MAEARKVKVTLVKSLIGRPEKHRKIVKALGLYKTNQEVIHHESPIINGMLHKISHLIKVEAA
jgi:large subunit ribosomal protein L30